MSDEELAAAILVLDDLAAEQFFVGGGWNRNDWEHAEIREFLYNPRFNE